MAVTEHVESDLDLGLLERKAQHARAEVIRLADVAGEGHYGSAFSIIEMMVALYYHHFSLRPAEPDWPDRDRFTLGKGHGAVGLYPILADLGYFESSRLDDFGRLGSSFGDHPNMHGVPGLDFSSGSIGHNLAVSVGMAIALRHRGSPARVVNLLGDGEQSEGQIWEAAAHGAQFGLGNLVAIVDQNHVQADGTTKEVADLEPVADKWKAFGWEVLYLPDGHDMAQVVDVLGQALEPGGSTPRVVLADTVVGKGVSFMEGHWQWHQGFLGPNDKERALDDIRGGLS